MNLNNSRTGKHATKPHALGLLGHSDFMPMHLCKNSLRLTMRPGFGAKLKVTELWFTKIVFKPLLHSLARSTFYCETRRRFLTCLLCVPFWFWTANVKVILHHLLTYNDHTSPFNPRPRVRLLFPFQSESQAWSFWISCGNGGGGAFVLINSFVRHLEWLPHFFLNYFWTKASLLLPT